MSLKIGIVGLPNVGKSTLFNSLTKNNVLVANYPFATIDPNIGIVKLIDKRVIALSEILKPKKTTFATIEFVDIAGLVKGASDGEGLGNKFLDHIRGVDLICFVVRCFYDKEIISINSNIDPIFDSEIVIWELIYSDIQRIEKIIKKLKSNDEKLSVLEKILTNLKNGIFISELSLTEKELKMICGYCLLTEKKYFFLGNISNLEKDKPLMMKLEEQCKKKNIDLIFMNINYEYEISQLPEEEQLEYLSLLDDNKNALMKLIEYTFKKLNLKNFFTVGEDEVKSWTFKENWTVQQCAGLIHSDIAQHFIKAKIIKYSDFIKCPSINKLRESGKLIIEGKNYKTKDADILNIEFKV